MKNHVLISWNESCITGIPILDEQHRGIISIINSFEFAIQRGIKTEFYLNTIFTMMDCYTKIHFSTEEELFLASGFPEHDAKAHQEMHIHLIKKSFSIASQSIRLQNPNMYLEFLNEWWMSHIFQQDRLYVPFVKEYLGI